MTVTVHVTRVWLERERDSWVACEFELARFGDPFGHKLVPRPSGFALVRSPSQAVRVLTPSLSRLIGSDRGSRLATTWYPHGYDALTTLHMARRGLRGFSVAAEESPPVSMPQTAAEPPATEPELKFAVVFYAVDDGTESVQSRSARPGWLVGTRDRKDALTFDSGREAAAWLESLGYLAMTRLPLRNRPVEVRVQVFDPSSDLRGYVFECGARSHGGTSEASAPAVVAKSVEDLPLFALH
jgi:hypothetical protein